MSPNEELPEPRVSKPKMLKPTLMLKITCTVSFGSSPVTLAQFTLEIDRIMIACTCLALLLLHVNN